MTLTVAEAKARLEEILFAAANGESVTVKLENGQAVQVTPAPQAGKRGLVGSSAGKIWMSDDFDAPLEEFREYME